MQHISILGSTGSIGTSTLDVVSLHPDRFKIVALSANSQVDLLFRQCVQFKPRYAVLLAEDAASDLRRRVREASLGTEVLSGIAALEQIVSLPEVDAVMAAIVGAAGLRPTLAAASGSPVSSGRNHFRRLIPCALVGKQDFRGRGGETDSSV